VLYQLPSRPQRLGDIVSLAFRIYRQNWRVISRRIFGPSLLASLAVSLIQISIVHWTQTLRDHSPLAMSDFIFFGVGLLIILVCQFVLAMRATALYREIFLDEDYKEALKYAFRRKWTVFSIFTMGAMLPVFIGMFLGLIMVGVFLIRLAGGVVQLLVVPFSFIAGVLFVVGTAISLLVTTLLFAVVSHEDVSFFRIVSRTFYLSFLYPFRGGSYMCLLGISLFMVLIACTIFLTPFELYEGYMAVRDSTGDSPFYLRVLEAISQTINNIVSMAVAIVGAGLYYRDVQFRAEGADLTERLADFETAKAKPDPF